MIRINQIKFDVNDPITEAMISKKVAHALKISESTIERIIKVKESIDARRNVVISYTFDVAVKNEKALLKKGFKRAPQSYEPIYVTESKLIRAYRESERESQLPAPVIIGYGPAGMFAGLTLAKAGMKPIIYEMGEDIDQRDETIKAFWSGGQLNEKSNVQFGAGGAGTYSDGKLTTRIKDRRIEMVIEAFIEAGAPEEIRYKNKPHIGTDLLKGIVKSITKTIEAYGGTVCFNHEVTDFKKEDKRITAIELNQDTWIPVNEVILAIGHSSRRTFEKLHKKQLEMIPKPFAVGVRIEHPQSIINLSQYGRAYKSPNLGQADYKLTYQTKKGRSVYSFCMCPGGSVVASASEKETIVVNGMSEYKRDSGTANSALLVNVNPEDYMNQKNPTVLDGMYFQRAVEKKAYQLTETYRAPSQTVGEFLNQTLPIETYENNWKEKYGDSDVDYHLAFESLKPSYRPDVVSEKLEACLPTFIYEAIREALPVFGQKIKGYDDPRAILTGVETRSSSPIRMIRDIESLESSHYEAFYPCGEGAGYAGGITSSAVDGIKVAEKVILKRIQSIK